MIYRLTFLFQFFKKFCFGFCLLSLFVISSTHAQQQMKANITLFPAGDFVATTKDITGYAELNANNEVKAQNIIVNLKNIKTGLELRDDHAKNKYIEVQKYPEAVLVSAIGKNGKGSGILRFHGKEAKISGTYKLLGGNKFLKAEFTTKLSDFNFKDISYKGVGVEDEFRVEIIVPLNPAAKATLVPAVPRVKK